MARAHTGSVGRSARWRRGWAALERFTEREDHARTPYGHRAPGPYPLEQWVAEQRRAYRAGQMTGQHAQAVEKLGIARSPADERFQENPEAAKAYYDQHWTLCAPRSATALDRPVGNGCPTFGSPVLWTATPSGRRRCRPWNEHWNPAWPTTAGRHRPRHRRRPKAPQAAPARHHSRPGPSLHRHVREGGGCTSTPPPDAEPTPNAHASSPSTAIT
ncbi:helicase associated domain-containing protein [Streptomyces sp. NPDC006235]|uniref:helicase associated domain-containing protein n=1 Tax=Streptomyces sp. NPDC006235 TaxID=3156736 RepID=UPI0033B14D15